MSGATNHLVIAASLCLSTTACRDNPPDYKPSEPVDHTDTATPAQPDTDGETDTATDTDGDTDDPGAEPTKVCKTTPSDDTPGDTVRWLCDGTAVAKRDLEVDEEPMIAALKNAVPTNIGDSQIESFVNNIEHMVDVDLHQFGPAYNDDAGEALTVIACCEDGYDYANTAPPDSPNAEHGLACAVDCVDQICRSVGFYLKDLGDQAVGFDIPIVPDILEPFGFQKDIRDDFYALANFYNEHGFAECLGTFEEEDADSAHRKMVGTFDVDEFIANARAVCDENPDACLLPNLKLLKTEWILNLDYEGTCRVGITEETSPNYPGWHPTDDPCDSISDNDDLGFPWNQSSRGGGWLGGDDFALVAGHVSVQGPELFGLDISGSAALQSAAQGCEADDRCPKLSIRFDRDTAILRELDLPLPTALHVAVGDIRASIMDGRLLLNESLVLPLHDDVITIPPGALSMAVSANVLIDDAWTHALLETATNDKELKIRVAWDGDDAYSLTIPTWTLAHQDVYGSTWHAAIEAHEWYPTEQSPKARLNITNGTLTATDSSDPEDAPLTNTWSLTDGTKTSTPPALTCTPQSIQLCVKDSTNKEDCTVQNAKLPTCE